jgi:hypothetical protein
MKMSIETITMSQVANGYMKFSGETQAATFYRRGNPIRNTNIDCMAQIECYTYPDGYVVGIWAEGMHIRVPLADIAAVVSTDLTNLKEMTAGQQSGRWYCGR